jgi:hypothetical protein
LAQNNIYKETNQLYEPLRDTVIRQDHAKPKQATVYSKLTNKLRELNQQEANFIVHMF